MNGEPFFKITHSDAMRPFFMSIVSDSNHWLFISSNGGLTAGRKNAEHALFPYYTDDKITETIETSGTKTIFRVQRAGKFYPWEPFSFRHEGKYRIQRNLYKNTIGNKVLFEEINIDLHLTFRYQWSSSNRFGFVRQATLSNQGSEGVTVSLMDGLQNILPYGVPSDLQMRSSNLVDAYKRSELESDTGLGIYALSAIIVDKAEPSEALKANVVWSLGLKPATHLLSSRQLEAFRKGIPVREETDIKGERGAYFLQADLQLAGGAEKEWMIIADVNKNHSAVAALSRLIREEAEPGQIVRQDVEQGTEQLVRLVAAADGLQCTADVYRTARHFSNTLFNIMRGGIFDHNYQVEKWDLVPYLKNANKALPDRLPDLLSGLPARCTYQHLSALTDKSGDADLRRLILEYLPLKFSRRHGDPSRPWNRFSIETRHELDGSKILNYEGNWRDIFQNWEALALSYPGFLDAMIHKFLNASTFDGYNPYRITKDGFDWETIEPHDPWSYIGYWGDHQIIYLLKLLELQEKHSPGHLCRYFDDPVFVYANVPYRIKPLANILKNPKDTIDFDREADRHIRQRKAAMGADGALLTDRQGGIYRVNFIEKILATLLAKLSNFIPEGGIWMNTQRPEWNDANNALVGNGISMVTLYYLRRFLHFFQILLADVPVRDVDVSAELLTFFKGVAETLEQFQDKLSGPISDQDRMRILLGVGEAGSKYRGQIYENSFSGQKGKLPLANLNAFLDLSLRHVERSIAANKRADGLFHAYNLLAIRGADGLSVSHLSEMLEGQVAILSSGNLSATQALEVLDALKASKLFREDQYSYLLYPNKDLPRFKEKNIIPEAAVASCPLLTQLAGDGNLEIIERDVNGAYHFNGTFKNANDLRRALEQLPETYDSRVAADSERVLEIFEEVFDHKAFTGRSGTFYGYEGLGSIYWHMVSKLLLAVQECCLKALADEESEELIGRLLEHYYEINEGIGVQKPPILYGAFPTDPYSHTPAGKGAQQPGMTGQVKEDILSRFGELGVLVRDGRLCFDPCLLRKTEFVDGPGHFAYVDVHSQYRQLSLEPGMLAFTYCQVPVVYQWAEREQIEVVADSGERTRTKSLELDEATSREIFHRTGEVVRLTVHLDPERLR